MTFPIRVCGLLAAMFVMPPMYDAGAAPPDQGPKARAGSSSVPGEVLEISVKPNPIVAKGTQLGVFDIAVTGRGTCDQVVIYITLPEDPPPSGQSAWDHDKKDVVFSATPAKTGTVDFGNGSFSMVGTYKRVVWAYAGPGSKNCKGRAKAVVTVTKTL
jgi:hypothetical protein